MYARGGGWDAGCESRGAGAVNPAESFEPFRRRLMGLAYRMLGSLADAEDAVQETYLRWHGAKRETVQEPRAFLMTTATRICLDMIGAARARREEYVGTWLPEPVVDAGALGVELAEDLSIALLLTLDRLSPLERAAFLLHDVFDFSFEEVSRALERSEAACRQLAARARAHVREVRPRGVISSENKEKHAALLTAFLGATRSGDLSGLMSMLSIDARVMADGGGKASAAMNVLGGADRAARFLIGATRKGWREEYTVRAATINGLPGAIVDGPDGPVQTVAFEIENGLIRGVYIVRNPDKLQRLPKLLSGGNPQIAKGDGDEPVQAYIAAMPGWKRDVGARLDGIIERTVPGVHKAVKWNSPFYGVTGQGWFLSFHCFAKYVKVAFFRGLSLEPVPPVESKSGDTRYVHYFENGEFDEAQFAAWVRQASELPGEKL